MSEILARLAPGTQSTDATPGVTGERVSQSDIAASMKGIDSEICDLMLAMDAGFTGLEHKLIKIYLIKVKVLASEEKWKEPKKNFYKTLTTIALFETIKAQRCNRCKGRGEHPDPETGLLAQCGKCGGSGNGKTKDSVKAKMIGIARQSYEETWKTRFLLIMNILIADYQEGNHKLNRGLRVDK